MARSAACLLMVLLVCNYIESGTPALSKAAMQQTQSLMKNMCKRSSGVSQDALNQLKAGNFIDDPKLKCYVHCCLGMMKTMKKDKITVPEATRQIEMLLPEEMKEASLKQLNSCKDSAAHKKTIKKYKEEVTVEQAEQKDNKDQETGSFHLVTINRLQDRGLPTPDIQYKQDYMLNLGETIFWLRGGTDACDKALNFAKCGYEIDPKNMLIPT